MAEEQTTPVEVTQTEPTTPPPQTDTNADALKSENDKLREEIAKLKSSVTAASSQAADYKRKWQATMSEQERRDQEIAEQRAAEKAQLEQLLTEKRVSGYTARLMEVGYDAQTAKVMAAALPEGVSDEYFSVQKSFIEGKIQATKSELLNSQPSVTPGASPTQKASEAAEMERLRKAFGV